MKTIDSGICDIPLQELENVEEIAFQMMQMSRETVMDQFDDVYEDTLEACLNTFDCKGMFKSFAIESADDTSIALEGGAVLESGVLSKYLDGADELVVYAVALHGYEKLANEAEGDMFDSMFYNAWGIGYSMSAHRWMKAFLAKQAREAGRFAGRGWTPGEDKLEFSLQGPLFELLGPSAIGMSLLDNGLMSPLMSVSGIMGISSDPAFVQVGSDVASSH